MWKMILGQSIYKLTVCLTLYFAGAQILNYDTSDPDKALELDTIVFNTFVWMQIFNELNNRRLDNKLNIFERIQYNYWFMGINTIMVGGQILIIFVGGAAIGVTPLDGVQWAISIGCSIFCIPWAVVLKFVPDEWVKVIIDWVVWMFEWLVWPFKRVWQGMRRRWRLRSEKSSLA